MITPRVREPVLPDGVHCLCEGGCPPDARNKIASWKPLKRITGMNASLVLRQSAVSMMLFGMSLFLTLTAHAQHAPADGIVGIWEADDGSVKLDMYKAGAAFEARLLYGSQVVESDNVTFKLDTRNPDPALRSRSLKNIVFLSGLR